MIIHFHTLSDKFHGVYPGGLDIAQFITYINVSCYTPH